MTRPNHMLDPDELEKVRQQRRDWYARHRDEQTAKAADYRTANRPAVNAARRAYYDRNRDREMAASLSRWRRRRAQKEWGPSVDDRVFGKVPLYTLMEDFQPLAEQPLVAALSSILPPDGQVRASRIARAVRAAQLHEVWEGTRAAAATSMFIGELNVRLFDDDLLLDDEIVPFWQLVFSGI